MRPVVVIKVSGSLFDLPDLATRVTRAIDAVGASRSLLVPGGGSAADVVRRWDVNHELGEERAHRLAIRALDLNAALLCELIVGWRMVATRPEAEVAWQRQSTAILTPHEFAVCNEPESDVVLPHHWNATSDSVAAWVARVWPADELVLLKSTDLPDGADLNTAARAGLVDPVLGSLAASIARVGWINLRRAPHELVRV